MNIKYFLEKLKNFIVVPFAIYLYNLIASPFNCLIPINIFSVLFVGFLGIPGLITLIIFFAFVF